MIKYIKKLQPKDFVQIASSKAASEKTAVCHAADQRKCGVTSVSFCNEKINVAILLSLDE